MLMDAFIQRHLAGVSRTYAILIPLLPEPLAEPIGLAYLLMRIVDTFEDDPSLPATEREALLRELDQVLAEHKPPSDRLCLPRGELAAERELMTEADRVLAGIRALEPAYAESAIHCARQMIAGVQMMLARSTQRGVAYPGVLDADELRTYCYYVAGVVGEMLCAMMAHYLSTPGLLERRDLAVDLGLGLQLVNILKDCVKDSAHGRRYLPTLQSGSAGEQAVFRDALAMARACLTRGVRYVLALPPTAPELRTFCGLPIAWGALTLNRAEIEPHAAKIDRAAIAWTLERFSALASDDGQLESWLTALLTGEPARATDGC